MNHPGRVYGRGEFSARRQICGRDFTHASTHLSLQSLSLLGRPFFFTSCLFYLRGLVCRNNPRALLSVCDFAIFVCFVYGRVQQCSEQGEKIVAH